MRQFERKGRRNILLIALRQYVGFMFKRHKTVTICGVLLFKTFVNLLVKFSPLNISLRVFLFLLDTPHYKRVEIL